MDRHLHPAKRNNSYDLLRILSTFAVILIHVNATTAGLSNISLVGANVCNYINVITRFSVPCFVMISGAFLLSNEDNIKYGYFYLKSFYKIGIPFLIFTAVVFVVSLIASLVTGSGIKNIIISLLFGGIDNYWFMFMLIGLYFLTPMIIRIKKSISNKCYCAGSFVWAVLAVISQSTSTYKVSYSFGVVFSFLSFFLIGNVIYENVSKKQHSFIFIISSIIVFSLAFVLRFVTEYSEFSVDPFASWFSPLIFIASVLLFVGFTKMEVKMNLAKLSSYTYIIYLLHTKVYTSIIKILEKTVTIDSRTSLFIIAAVTVITFAISLIGAVVYTKIWGMLENKFELKIKLNKVINKSFS